MGSLLRVLSDKMRMMREDAIAVSQVVEEAFAGQSELDDEFLDKDLRQVFYDLQDEKILEVRRVELREEGQSRRHYLWSIRDDEEFGPAPEPTKPDPAERLYARLGEQAWERRNIPE